MATFRRPTIRFDDRKHTKTVLWLLGLVSLFVAGNVGATDAMGESEAQQQQVTAQSANAGESACLGGLAPITDKWQLARASLGATIVAATNSQRTYQTDILASRHSHGHSCGRPHSQIQANVRFGYDARRNPGKPLSLNRTADLQLHDLFYLNNNARALTANAETFHNSSIGVQLQQSVGVGVSALIGSTLMQAELRPTYLRYYTEAGQHLFASRFGIQRTFTPRIDIQINTELHAIPVFNKREYWQAGGFLNVTVPIGKTNFAFGATAFDDYANNPPSKFKRNYLNLTMNVSFTPK